MPTLSLSPSVGLKVGELSNLLTDVEGCQSNSTELVLMSELVLFCFKFDQLKVCFI